MWGRSRKRWCALRKMMRCASSCLKRAAECSWKRTAELTMEVYEETCSPPQLRRGEPKPQSASLIGRSISKGLGWGGVGQKVQSFDQHHPGASRRPSSPEEGSLTHLPAAIHKTIEYAKLFDYPLHPDEIYDRLFDIKVDITTFHRVLDSLQLETDRALWD